MSSPCYSPVDIPEIVGNCASRLSCKYAELMEALGEQGPNEIAAALDNLEGVISQVREDLRLG